MPYGRPLSLTLNQIHEKGYREYIFAARVSELQLVLLNAKEERQKVSPISAEHFTFFVKFIRRYLTI